MSYAPKFTSRHGAERLLPTSRLFLAFSSLCILTAIALSTAGVVLLGDDPSTLNVILHKAFWVDQEKNATTFLSFVLLVACAFFASHAARVFWMRGDTVWRSWASISALFVLASYDEAAGVHEEIGHMVRDAIDAEGALYFSWVIPGSIILCLLGLVFYRFVFRQQPRVRMLMISSAVLYFAGTIGMEMVGGAIFFERASMSDPFYRLAVTVEEAFEMIGAMLFATASLLAMEQSADLQPTD